MQSVPGGGPMGLRLFKDDRGGGLPPAAPGALTGHLPLLVWYGPVSKLRARHAAHHDELPALRLCISLLAVTPLASAPGSARDDDRARVPALRRPDDAAAVAALGEADEAPPRVALQLSPLRRVRMAWPGDPLRASSLGGTAVTVVRPNGAAWIDRTAARTRLLAHGSRGGAIRAAARLGTGRGVAV